MSIGVQSYPEMYTLLLGWGLYDKIWEMLTQTGLAYLPFIGILLRNVYQSYVSPGPSTAEYALRHMELSFITTLFLILFGAAPFVSLNVHTVAYSPVCGGDKGRIYHPGESGTTYDKAFAIPEGDVRVPLWWYAVIAVSEGITQVASTNVGCVPNIRKMVAEVDMAKISDPAIKEQLQDFESMCYSPARLQYFSDSRGNKKANLARIQDNLKKYGADDTEWLGSHAFNEVYYHQLNASRPVSGFPYDLSKDINADTHLTETATDGTPSCYEWWNNAQHGLKNNVYQALPKSFWDEFKLNLSINDELAKEDVIKKIISNASSGYAGYSNANDTIGNMGYSHLISAAGIWFHQLEEYPKIYAASQAAPIIQALLLLMVYVFLPFALVFSGYRPAAFITGAMMIFSLIFWSFIWHLVSWTDKSLIQALYANWFTKQGAGATLADMIIGALVIVAPLFWFMFMGTMGIAVADGIGNLTSNLTGISGAASKKGSDNAKKAIARF